MAYSNTGSGGSEGFRFSIIDKIGALAIYKNGWRKELNVVKWNDNPPKFDLRDWSPDHEHMGRGTTLNREEAEKLAQILNRYFVAGGMQTDIDRDVDLDDSEDRSAEEVPETDSEGEL